jgi:hypothetical protein
MKFDESVLTATPSAGGIANCHGNARRLNGFAPMNDPIVVARADLGIISVSPLFQIDDGRLLNQLAVWAPDAATRKLILVDNPARFYQF